MFRKRKELSKTPSVSKKSQSGNPGTQCSSLSVLQEQPRRDPDDGTSMLAVPDVALLSSCPGTPSTIHGKLVASSNANLKRSTGLSRHASAAGFPFHTAGTWGFSRTQMKCSESTEGTVIDVEDIPPLLRDVAHFAEAVEKLKDVVLCEDKESRRAIAHEYLGEVLRILRQVISTYPLLNTVETLTAAGRLISQVKGFCYEGTNEAQKKDFEKAIETIAVAFSSNVSELLMGEVDSSTLLSLPPTEKSRSLENLNTCGLLMGQGMEGGNRCDHDCMMSPEQVDILLQHSEGGVDSALSYAKAIAKYMKDIISYVDKRIALEMEFAKGIQRLYHSSKQSFTQTPMPLLSIYSLALEQDLEQSTGVQQSINSVLTHSFLQPLMQRKQEHEKKRREIKEQWQRAKRKLADAENNLRKARQWYLTRCEEYEKARLVANKVEEEHSGAGSGSTHKTLDRKRRHEEEARNKSEEAEATYRTCIADATTQQQELEDVKVNVLKQIQDVIRQSDQILRACTISYYQILHMQTAPLPVHYQTLCESCNLYDPGQQYAAHIKNLQLSTERVTVFQFEPYSASGTYHPARPQSENITDYQQQSSTETPNTNLVSTEGGVVKTRRDRAQQAHKSWPSTVSDTESVGGGSGLGSPTTSSGDVSKASRPVSAGTLSSIEDLDDHDGNVTSFEQSMNGIEPEMTVSTGPFRNMGLSKAAKTHRLRKLRTPSKCRECDSYVYFQGAECEECFLACHKKCLESLAIQCGHKKLQGRLQLFGRDFSQVLQGDSEGVPFIIKKCIQEIEKRALSMKGIYRVNGVKTRVEKLCQAFENGKELVELSQASPHDISNVLKLYLRQLPEPIMPFRMYNKLMGLAKESLYSDGPDRGDGAKGPEILDQGEQTDPMVLNLVEKLRELLKDLQAGNIATLKYIVRHLHRVAELEDDNKMSFSNLGIVFGPTLMRPKPTGATISLSSLVDYPHQARIVEALIVFQDHIFSPSAIRLTSSSSPGCTNQGQESTDEAQDVEEEQNRLISEQDCGNSLGSSGSRERSLDTDSDGEDMGKINKRCLLVSQVSETSTEDDQISPRVSLDLSTVVPDTVPEQPSDTEDFSGADAEELVDQ
ncbi:rho GTPase-activating protein 45 [Tachysurus fulvidraco]|uniref:rho GTPase-activating protein 45 n=1 Tax=Tachysurus fulvidraco TaxID=1234273 RepID=UPI000F4EF744|nr:rho GTPase-activating protein 45 [Tachysurus fulvidraco]